YPAMGAAWWQDLFARLPHAARRGLGVAAARGPDTFRRFVASLAERPEIRNQLLIGGIAPTQARGLLSGSLRAAVGAFDPFADIDAHLEECPSDDRFARLVHRFCRGYLAGQNLANADRASMANALELRAPFLDHRFVELIGRVPPSLRLPGLRRLKRLLKDA